MTVFLPLEGWKKPPCSDWLAVVRVRLKGDEVREGTDLGSDAVTLCPMHVEAPGLVQQPLTMMTDNE